jgi:DNA-3-methyladenine glycosylase I
LAEILQDPGIVRNRLKVRAFQTNAVKFLELREQFGSFDVYLWDYVGGKPLQHSRGPADEAPAKTDLSDKVSVDLKRRGFKFAGSTICYAFLQSAGLVNDHHMSCFRHQEVRDLVGA